jgi:hypothetical protein
MNFLEQLREGKHFAQRSQRKGTETTERFRDILRALCDQVVR